jgi:hypothetical protein
MYSSTNQSILEYACPGRHPGITQQLFEYIAAIQNGCFRILYPAITYAEALAISGLERLDEIRERFTTNIFEEIKKRQSTTAFRPAKFTTIPVQPLEIISFSYISSKDNSRHCSLLHSYEILIMLRRSTRSLFSLFNRS